MAADGCWLGGLQQGGGGNGVGGRPGATRRAKDAAAADAAQGSALQRGRQRTECRSDACAPCWNEVASPRLLQLGWQSSTDTWQASRDCWRTAWAQVRMSLPTRPIASLPLPERGRVRTRLGLGESSNALRGQGLDLQPRASAGDGVFVREGRRATC